jgi:hypothetical protein
LPNVLAIPGHEGGLFALTDEARRHWLKVFALIFGRERSCRRRATAGPSISGLWRKAASTKSASPPTCPTSFSVRCFPS